MTLRLYSFSLIDPGYDFDIVNTDVLLNRMQVQNQRIVLPDGMSYRLLVLPDREDIPDEVIEKVENMIQDGAKVLIQGAKLAKEMEESILAKMSINAALTELSISKDFTSESGLFDYIHRKNGKTDLYFIRNKTDKWLRDFCSFRVNKGKPELWDRSFFKTQLRKPRLPCLLMHRFLREPILLSMESKITAASILKKTR